MVDEQFRIDVIIDPAKSKPGIDRAQKDIERIEKEAADLRGALVEALSVRDAGTTRVLENVNKTLLRSERLAENTQRAVFQIGEDVNTAGVRDLGDEVERTERNVSGLTKAFGRLFAGFTAGLAVREFVQLGDSIVELRNRLRLVTEAESELNDVQSELFDIAKETGSEFDSVSTIFRRLAFQADSLGRSNQELLGFTRSLNQAVFLSGARAQEANAAMIQLSQGLAAGALRGDEFRSVSEQLPVVLQVIAKQTGLTRAEIRELAHDGQLTADIIIDSFAAAAGSLEEDLDTVNSTVARSFQRLRLTAQENAAAAAEATSGALALALDDFTEKVKVSIDRIRIGTREVAADVAGFLAEERDIGFGISIKGDDALVNFLAGLSGADETLSSTRRELDRFTNAIQDQRERGVEPSRGQVEALFRLYNRLDPQLARAANQVDDLTDALEKQALRGVSASQSQRKELDRLRDTIESLREENRRRAESQSDIAAAESESEKSIRGVIESLEREREQLMLSRAEREIQEEVEKRLAEIRKDNADITDDRLESVRNEIEASVRFNAGLERQNQIIDKIRGPAREYEQTIRDLETALEAGRISQQEFNRAVAGLKTPERGEQEEDPFARFTDSLQRQNDQLAIRLGFQGEEQRFLLAKEQIESRIGLLNDEQLEQLRSLIATQQERTDLTKERAEAEREAREAEREAEREAAREQQAIDALVRRIDLERQFAEERRIARAAFEQGKITEIQLEEELARIRGSEAQAQTQHDQERLDALFRQIEATDNLAEKERLLSGARGEGIIDEDQFEGLRLEALEASTDIEAGFERAFIKIGQQADDFASKAEDAINSFANSSADAIAEFATTGKFEFEEFASSVIQSITRIATEALVQQAIKLIADLASQLSGGGGGSSATIDFTAQAGGNVSAGQVGLVGEQGPELFVPSRSGRIIPTDQLQSGAAAPAQPQVNLSVVNLTDPKELAGAINSGDLDQAIINRINRNKRRVRGALR